MGKHKFNSGQVCEYCGGHVNSLSKGTDNKFLPCPESPEDGREKSARTYSNISQKTAMTICPTFDGAVLSDVSLAVAALKSKAIAPIPVDRFIELGSGLLNESLFVRTDGEEAAVFVDAFKAFEDRCSELRSDLSDVGVLCAITSITGMLWKALAPLVEDFGPDLTYNYNAKDYPGATQAGRRPDETVFLSDFLGGKGEHKRTRTELKDAVAEQTEKLAGYNHVEDGPRIICLPVYSAAGPLVEYGVVDVRTKTYYRASRHNTENAADRCDCFVGSINFFRYLRTMAPFIPSHPSPIFKTDLVGFVFFTNYVLKKIPATCTCPQALYELLATGSVPCAAKVVKTAKSLKVSPVGVRTPDKGEGLTLAEVRAAIGDCLRCLAYLHRHNYVHRDIRWANLIRTYTAGSDGSVKEVQFLVIDFEFSGVHDQPMDIQGYKFREVVPYGDSYKTSHDLYLVGTLITTWAERNNETLDASALNMVRELQSGVVTAQEALAHQWLA